MTYQSPASLAIAQVSVADPGLRFPLLPPLLTGVPENDGVDGVGNDNGGSTPQPLELDFDYDAVDTAMFRAGAQGRGLDRWSQLMPPLVASTNLGEGGTALVDAPRLASWAGTDRPVYVKDEGRNPTWSHKDRLNRCTVSAACLVGAPGVVVASSGNHGASAAAFAAAAGLPCIVLASATAPLAMRRFVGAYNAAALAVPANRRWALLAEIAATTGYHPVSNMTLAAHTGHPFAPEGYKSVAFEIFEDLRGEVPVAVFVPTGYGELLYGVWKGFLELKQLGLTASLPKMVCCEPAALAPHHRAVAGGHDVVTVDRPDGDTRALSIASPVGGLRGRKAVIDSCGQALALSDAEIADAAGALSSSGLWVEFSAAAGLAGLRRLAAAGPLPDGPVVCISTSSGFKDLTVDGPDLPESDGSLAGARTVIRDRYGLRL